jgi:hypothetical protein
VDALDVGLERVGVGEDLVADFAAEKAFAGVQLHVVEQLLDLGELLIAERALLETRTS